MAELDQAAGVTPRALWRWLGRVQGVARPNWLPALADARPAGPPAAEPAWIRPLLNLYRQPQKPSLADALARLPAELPEDVECPSYGQVKRRVAQMSAIERTKGRMGPVALLSKRAFVRRTTAHMLPLDTVTCDGHCADLEVADRETGQPCRPEITLF